jgi:hypothetical protein
LLLLHCLFQWPGLLAGRAELGVELGLLLFGEREFLTHRGDQIRVQQATFQPVFDMGGVQTSGHEQ